MSSFSYWEAVHRVLQICQVGRKDHLLLALTWCPCSSRDSSGCCQPSVLLTNVQLADNHRRSPRSFFAKLLPSPWATNSPGAGLCFSPRSPSLGSCQPVPPASRGLSMTASLGSVINHSSNYLSSSNLLNVHSVASLMSLHQGISQYSSHTTPLTCILNFSISRLLQPRMPLIFTLPDHQRDKQ